MYACINKYIAYPKHRVVKVITRTGRTAHCIIMRWMMISGSRPWNLNSLCMSSLQKQRDRVRRNKKKGRKKGSEVNIGCDYALSLIQ